jgi:hypothetical protein
MDIVSHFYTNMFDNNHFNYDVTSAKPYFCHHVQVFGGFSY